MTDYRLYYTNNGWSTAFSTRSDAEMQNLAQQNPYTVTGSLPKTLTLTYDPVAQGLISKSNDIDRCGTQDLIGTWSPAFGSDYYQQKTVGAKCTVDSGNKLYRIRLNPHFYGDWLDEISLTFYVYVVVDGTFTISASAGSHGSVSPTSLTVQRGEDATFTATPDTGYVVADWSLDGVSQGVSDMQYTIDSVTANHTVSVTFTNSRTAKTISLTDVWKGEKKSGEQRISTDRTMQKLPGYPGVKINGTPTYTNCSGTVDVEYVTDNKHYDVEYEITPTNAGAFSVVFNVDCYRNANVIEMHTVTISGTAGNVYSVTYDTPSHGTITLSATSVHAGGSYTATFTPATGYTLGTVKVNGVTKSVTGNTLTVSNVQANQTVNATFEAIARPTVTPSVYGGVGGQINPSEPLQVDYDSDVLMSFIPATGYSVVAIRINGTRTAWTTNAYMLSHVTQDTTFSVEFGAAQHLISITKTGNGTIDPASDTYVNDGEPFVLTATPDEGYAIESVLLDGEEWEPDPEE